MRRRSLLASTLSLATLSGCLGLTNPTSPTIITKDIVGRECNPEEINSADVTFQDTTTIKIDGTIAPATHCSQLDVSPMTSSSQDQSDTTIVRIITTPETTCENCQETPTAEYSTTIEYPNRISEVQVDHDINGERIVPATVEQR